MTTNADWRAQILAAFDLDEGDLAVLAEMTAASERAKRDREDFEARLGERFDRIARQINDRLPDGVYVALRFD